MPFLGTTGGGSVKQYGGQANLGYFIKNSLRFRSSASGNLSRTPGSSSNQRTWTWSGWVKRGALSYGESTLFNAGTTGIGTNDTGFLGIRFTVNDQLDVTTGATDLRLTTQVFRDPSAWYHIVIAFDTTQATGANRVKIYVNGTQVTAYSGTDPSLNLNTAVNNTYIHEIARTSWNGAGYFDGYMAEINFVDGQALTPSSFGKTDAATNQWIPKKFAGTYGTNGFYLKFADASAATAAAIGKDSSPNGNNLTPNNISVTAGVTYDAMIDSPTLSAAASNYAVLNPLGGPAGGLQGTLSNGNLTYTSSTTDQRQVLSTMSVNENTTGKWYCEITATSKASTYWAIGMFTTNINGYSSTSGYAQYRSDGAIFVNGSNVTSVTSYTTGDVIGMTFDASNNELKFYKNNTLVSTQTVSNSAGALSYFGCGSDSSGSSAVYNANFGQRPFAYTPPSGFKSLNTFNLS